MMWDKRRDEIDNTLLDTLRWGEGWMKYRKKFGDKIIFQEKEMIREIMIELFDKTACQDYCEICAEDKKIINKLLSERQIKKI